MKSAIKRIVGKTIKGVFVKERHTGNPKSQVFFVFDDDTHYELYSDSTIKGIGGIDSGGMDFLRSNTESNSEIILEHVEP